MSAVAESPVRTRFLGAIAGALPPEQVVEIHLFGAMRQGGMESGVAVVAVDAHGVAPASVTVAQDEEADALVGADPAVDDAPVAEAESVEAVLEEPVVDADGQVADSGESATGDTSDASDHAGYDAPVDETPLDVAAAAPATPAPRYTIYTARYRLTLKGPDRGKWEASVTEEADAPLLTVDAVVRGVSRRSGEDDDAVRLSGDEFRAALPDPLPPPAVRALPVLRVSPALRAPVTAKRA